MNPKRFDIDIIIEEDIKELADLKLPDPTLLDFFNRMARREIYWNTDIDDGLLDFSLQIMDWNREDKDTPIEDRKPIKIFINSRGGCLNSVMHFINVIQLSKTPVYTIGMGKCQSAGGLLLMAGHKRLIFEDTIVLLHDGSTGAFGDTGKVIDNLRFTERTEDRVKNFILENTNISEKLYKENERRDWFMFSDEAIEYGIADKIIKDLDDII